MNLTFYELLNHGLLERNEMTLSTLILTTPFLAMIFIMSRGLEEKVVVVYLHAEVFQVFQKSFQSFEYIELAMTSRS